MSWQAEDHCDSCNPGYYISGTSCKAGLGLPAANVRGFAVDADSFHFFRCFLTSLWLYVSLCIYIFMICINAGWKGVSRIWWMWVPLRVRTVLSPVLSPLIRSIAMVVGVRRHWGTSMLTVANERANGRRGLN